MGLLNKHKLKITTRNKSYYFVKQQHRAKMNILLPYIMHFQVRPG